MVTGGSFDEPAGAYGHDTSACGYSALVRRQKLRRLYLLFQLSGVSEEAQSNRSHLTSLELGLLLGVATAAAIISAMCRVHPANALVRGGSVVRNLFQTIEIC